MVVGINLLREGLDLPEVSLVAVLDADKEGYLRSEEALVQTMGRAARHVSAHAILYADRITDSMRRAMDETQRRRKIQGEYNTAHGITPAGIQKAIRDISDRVREAAETADTHTAGKSPMPRDQIARLIRDLEQQMKQASKALEFEQAALLRDQIVELRRELAGGDLDDLPQWSDQSYGRRGRRPSAAAAGAVFPLVALGTLWVRIRKPPRNRGAFDCLLTSLIPASPMMQRDGSSERDFDAEPCFIRRKSADAEGVDESGCPRPIILPIATSVWETIERVHVSADAKRAVTAGKCSPLDFSREPGKQPGAQPSLCVLRRRGAAG